MTHSELDALMNTKPVQWIKILENHTVPEDLLSKYFSQITKRGPYGATERTAAMFKMMERTKMIPSKEFVERCIEKDIVTSWQVEYLKGVFDFGAFLNSKTDQELFDLDGKFLDLFGWYFKYGETGCTQLAHRHLSYTGKHFAEKTGLYFKLFSSFMTKPEPSFLAYLASY